MATLSVKFANYEIEGIREWDEEVETRSQDTNIARRDGVISDDFPPLEIKTIRMEGVLVRSTHEELRTALGDLEYMLFSLGKQALQIFSDRFIYAVVRSFKKDYDTSGKICEYELRFECADPYWLSVDKQTQTKSVISGSQTYNVSVGGNYYALPVFTFSPSSNCSSFLIKNQNTKIERFMRYTGTITAGKILKVDCVKKTIQCSGFNAMGYFVGDFLKFAPNETNTLLVTSSVAGSLLIEWYNCWV